MVNCNVYEVFGLRPDNLLSAELDLSEIVSQLSLVNSSDNYKFIDELETIARHKRRSETFSTMAKKARVVGSSLSIEYTDGRHEGIYRRLTDMVCSFSLQELNGRPVRFNAYSVRVQCWHSKNIFGGRELEDETSGSYNFDKALELSYLSENRFTPRELKRIAQLINQLKAAHENTMKAVQITLTLKGSDDADNELTVTMNSDRIPWKSLFEF